MAGFLSNLPKHGCDIEYKPADALILQAYQDMYASCISVDSKRADHCWYWPEITKRVFRYGAQCQPSIVSVCAAGEVTQNMNAYTVVDSTMPHPAQVSLSPVVKSKPLGLMALLEDEIYPIDESKRSVFVWFVSAAPTIVADSVYGTCFYRMVGAALLDYAVTRSIQLGHEGRVWLHADHAGGDSLVAWYKKQGMKQIQSQASIPKFWRRNDGRYFYYDEQSASSAIINLNGYR